MSRAFVKEPDGDLAGETLLDLPVSPHPNYVTPRGLAALEARLHDARARRGELAARPSDLGAKAALAQIDRDIRYLEARLAGAIPVDPANQPRAQVAFGAILETIDGTGHRRTFCIVGEDEADPNRGLISWVSPLARATIGASEGDIVTWTRPAGDLELEIVAIRYGDP